MSGRVVRSVAAELLYRTLFLHRWVNAHRHIARVQSFRSLWQAAKDILQDVSLDEHVVRRLGTTQGEILNKGWRPETWVELAVLLAYDDAHSAEAALPRAWALHASLVARATSHMALTEDNIMRTHWGAAGTLSKDPVEAQAAAQSFLRHLLTTAPARFSAFERAVAQNPVLMANLKRLQQ